MSTLIVYASSHGCTEKCAQKVSDQLASKSYLLNLKRSNPDDLNRYDTILIGGSIHVGKMQKAVKKFCENHLDGLLQK